MHVFLRLEGFKAFNSLLQARRVIAHRFETECSFYFLEFLDITLCRLARQRPPGSQVRGPATTGARTVARASTRASLILL